ncbi:hypothetical protein QAD02_015696 [Eretmocerus hayati]|uniref:Uncharacterized protein n=1 Tax=Eretmocerus hayati TaxID=131215 RepID=A0ACC2PBE5_9HYME|nr:hypothetical protein QAD02_015696 [Eretmocerus hayati]
MQVLLMFAGTTIANVLRISMSVAIVSMRKKGSTDYNFPEYNWDNRTSNLILSSFSWGYVITQIPGGYLSRRWSAGKIVSVGMLVSSVTSLLIPILSEYGPVSVMCCRMVMGLCQGPLMPCNFVMLSRWAPPAEKTRLSSLVTNATSFGTLIALLMSGYLAASRFGWPGIFKVCGTAGIAWSLLFYCTCADYPSEHPFIGSEELKYITDAIGRPNRHPKEKEPPIPWTAILSSAPLMSSFLAGWGTAWSFNIFLSQLPAYMSYVLKFNIAQSGMLSALPYLVKWLLCFPLSYLVDYAIGKGVPTVIVRKISSCMGSWIPAFALLVLCVSKTDNTTIILAIIIVAVGISSANECGHTINCMDLTNNANLIGPLMSINNCVGSCLGFIVPYICGIIITDESDQSQWFIIFYITAGVCFYSVLIFVIFGKAELQPWNDSVLDQKKTFDVTDAWGWRHVQAFLMFMGITVAYGLRISMSVAIVAMRNKASANPCFPEYDWDSWTTNLILSSFFWGYAITQLPGGYFAQMWSAGKLVAGGVLLSSIINMFTPTLAEYGSWPVILSRVAMGLCQGPLIPGNYSLLSRWVPPMERARLGSFVLNAVQFGTMISLPISGALAASRYGWPSIFYVFGAIGIAWSLLFYCTCADYPSEHPRIGSKELEYISESIGSLNKLTDDKEMYIPWKAILTSVPLWSAIVANVGSSWGFYTFFTQLPAYMEYILKFNISQSGMVSALPYLANWLLCFSFSYLSDFALQKGTPMVIVRKISSCIGSCLPALALILLCLTKTTDTVIILAMITVSVGLTSAACSGPPLTPIDLAPNFSGPIMAMDNCIENCLCLFAPYVCGIIIQDETDQDQWFIIFYITAGVYFLSNMIFVLFGEAAVQPWNNPATIDHQQSIKSP